MDKATGREGKAASREAVREQDRDKEDSRAGKDRARARDKEGRAVPVRASRADREARASREARLPASATSWRGTSGAPPTTWRAR